MLHDNCAERYPCLPIASGGISMIGSPGRAKRAIALAPLLGAYLTAIEVILWLWLTTKAGGDRILLESQPTLHLSKVVLFRVNFRLAAVPGYPAHLLVKAVFRRGLPGALAIVTYRLQVREAAVLVRFTSKPANGHGVILGVLFRTDEVPAVITSDNRDRTDAHIGVENDGLPVRGR